MHRCNAGAGEETVKLTQLIRVHIFILPAIIPIVRTATESARHDFIGRPSRSNGGDTKRNGKFSNNSIFLCKINRFSSVLCVCCVCWRFLLHVQYQSGCFHALASKPFIQFIRCIVCLPAIGNISFGVNNSLAKLEDNYLNSLQLFESGAKSCSVIPTMDFGIRYVVTLITIMEKQRVETRCFAFAQTRHCFVGFLC